MFEQRRWLVVLPILTFMILACEQSITSVDGPEVEFEALGSTALALGSCVEPGASLISWWTGDDAWADETGANPIVVKNAAFGSFTPRGGEGGEGQERAFEFSSDHQRIEILGSESLKAPAFTVDLWAERRGPGHSSGNDFVGNMLVQKAVDENGPGTSYFVSWNNTGHIVAWIDFAGNGLGNPVKIESSSSYADDHPIFIALTVDDLAATLYVYDSNPAEGQSVLDVTTSDVTELGSILHGDGRLILGANASRAGASFQRRFEGIIDEVEIFGRALTEPELRNIFARGGLNAGPDGEIDEGGVFTSAGAFFTNLDAASLTATADYGDVPAGVSEPVTLVDGPGLCQSLVLSHLYADDGVYEVTVTVSENGAVPVSATASVVVNNVAPSVSAGPVDAVIFEDGTYVSSVTFSDPGMDEWTAEISYGDGTVETPSVSVGTFEISHIYVGSGLGSYTVTVLVKDDDGGESIVTTAVVEVEAELAAIVIHEFSVDKAKVKLDRRDRPLRDRFDIEGRIPLDLREGFDPATDDVTIEFAGSTLVLPAGSLVRKGHRRNHMWRFTAKRRARGIRRFELRDDGRFKIQVRDVSLGLIKADFPGLLDVSISFGSERGETEVQLDSRGHRARRSHRRSGK